MRISSKLAVVLFVLRSVPAASATPITIDIEDVGSGRTGSLFNDGYYGFDWHFGAEDPVSLSDPFANIGYTNGLVSGSIVGFMLSGESSISRESSFDFVSAYLTAAWRNDVRVLVSGYLFGSLQYQDILRVDSYSPTLIEFNYYGVDRVTFNTSGGIDAGYGDCCSQIAVDNLTVFVPGPGTLALFGIGVFGMAFARRKKKA